MRFLIFFACFFAFLTVRAQPVLIDEGVQSDGLMCFPVYGDSLRYKYLPSRGRLSVSDGGLPEFSMLRYAKKRRSDGSTLQTVNEADGGSILHFLVLYDTPAEQVRRAESKLRQKLKRELRLEGPVLFTKGSYLVVSSILQDGKEKKTLLTSGEAPVFENSKVAFSFALDPTQSQLLAESFKMATPDISIMFDLSFSGLTQAYQAQLEVNWSEVEKHEYSNESSDFIFYSRDVEKTFGELMRTGAIKVSSAGKDSSSEALFSMVYDKVLNLMFNPVKPSLLPPSKTGGAIDDFFGNRGFSSLLGVGGSDVYKKKEVKTSGKTVVNINSRYNANRHHFVTFNIGDLWKKYGDNKRIFRDVTIDDPLYQQREVHVSIDGSLADEFDKMVNNVSVTLRKDHANGEQTLCEMLLGKATLANYKGPMMLTYLNKEDKDREKWIEYEYQVSWQFKTDGQYAQPWTKASTPMINLFTPYKHHEIYLEGDWEKLKAAGVRAVTVAVEYDFFGAKKNLRTVLRPADAGKEQKMSLILPASVQEVDYSINWVMEGGQKKEVKGKDKIGVIFWDEGL
jgi:hypothetical protein